MSEPSWLRSNGRELAADAPELRPLRRFFDVVAPQAAALIPVVIGRSLGAPGGPRSWEGGANLWDSESARFALSVDGADKPTAAWVAKPVRLASGITLPGVST